MDRSTAQKLQRLARPIPGDSHRTIKLKDALADCIRLSQKDRSDAEPVDQGPKHVDDSGEPSKPTAPAVVPRSQVTHLKESGRRRGREKATKGEESSPKPNPKRSASTGTLSPALSPSSRMLMSVQEEECSMIPTPSGMSKHPTEDSFILSVLDSSGSRVNDLFLKLREAEEEAAVAAAARAAAPPKAAEPSPAVAAAAAALAASGAAPSAAAALNAQIVLVEKLPPKAQEKEEAEEATKRQIRRYCEFKELNDLIDKVDNSYGPNGLRDVFPAVHFHHPNIALLTDQSLQDKDVFREAMWRRTPELLAHPYHTMAALDRSSASHAGSVNGSNLMSSRFGTMDILKSTNRSASSAAATAAGRIHTPSRRLAASGGSAIALDKTLLPPARKP